MFRIYHGNALNVMLKLIDKGILVDAVISDLPYGKTKLDWDQIIPFDLMWKNIKLLRKNTSPIILFGSEPFSSSLRLSNEKEYKYDLYWQKERLVNVLQVKKRAGKTIENIMIFYKKQCFYNPQFTKHKGKLVKNKVKKGSLGKLIDSEIKKVISYNDTGKRYPIDAIIQFNRDILKQNLYPTQKPVKLLEYLIKTYTKENDLILDFTMGSGTSAIACRNLNRQFIGIEIKKNGYEIAKKRLKENN